MRDRKPTYYEMIGAGQSMVVTRMSVQLLQPIRLYDHIEVRTWKCPSKFATFRRGYQIETSLGTAVRAYSEWAVNDFVHGGLVRTEDIDFSRYEEDEIPELDIPKKFHFKKGEEFQTVDSRPVYYSMTDMNGHMNNANYADLLWDYVPSPERKAATSINIRYMHDAKLGKDIQIQRAQADPARTGDPLAQEAWLFKTSVDGDTNVEVMFGLREVENPLVDEIEKLMKSAGEK